MSNQKTRTEHYYNNIYKTGSDPQVEIRGKLSNLSDVRRAKLAEADHEKMSITAIGSRTNLIKNAQVMGASASYKGNGDTLMQTPEVYSPLWLTSNLSLPKDRQTINAWCRQFYALSPLVQNAISLHSTYPISKLNLKCKNKEVENFFNEMIEATGLENICIQIAQQYYLLGEAFVYNEFDPNLGRWSRFVLQNADYMVCSPTLSGHSKISMMPDEHLKKICSSNSPKDIEQRKLLAPFIVEAVKRGGNIPLDDFNISHICRKNNPEDTRGTGLVVSVFRQLMLFDQLRECKYYQAANMVNPVTVVQVGSPEYKPDPGALEQHRVLFESAQNNKDFKIFTTDALKIEKVGSGTGIYDTSADITQLIKEIYIGLQVPSALMDGGADTTYANAGVALDLVRERYTFFRNLLATWLKTKVFLPIAEIHDFYEIENGVKKYIIPEVDWNYMSLFDTNDYIQNMITLSQEGEGKRVSMQTLHRTLGLDYQDEIRRIRRENIDMEILKKEKMALEKLDLNALRAISDDDEIKPPVDEEIKGGEGGEGEEDGALPGMDMGAPEGGDSGKEEMPDLPDLPAMPA